MSGSEGSVVEGLLRAFGGHVWDPITLGCSGADVFALRRDGEVVAYAKQGRDLARQEIEAEAQRVAWLDGRGPSPRLLGRGTDGEWAWMVCSAVDGIPACEPPHRDQPAATIARLAEALGQLHAFAADDCPFDASVDALMADGRERVARGWVDETDFDPERQGWTAREVLAALERVRPATTAPVLTHGDPCLPNIVFEGERLGGWIDLGGLGVGDRHRDLALAARSTDRNLGPGWGRRLLELYDGPIDEAALEFYRLMDELW